jgi:magnesium transporter
MSEQNQSGDPANIATPTSCKDVYAVNTEFVRTVEAALADNHGAALRELLAGTRPADIADLVVVLGDDLDIDTLIDLEGSVLEDLLAVMSPHAVARTIPELDTDEAVRLLKEMDEARRD